MSAMLEVGPMVESKSSIGKAASPGFPQLSIVISAISYLYKKRTFDIIK